ncbi:hypothetical protein ACAG26_13065 [Mycobacterium sp. pUA109]|uniref:hypothetical protein n=1 Tax=Mycobacterium sp. pUA109 TaxID=3238982 RepID=UPI00351BAED4
MTLTKHPATLTASVAAGLFLAMAAPHPTAAADPTPPPGPDTSNADETAALEQSVAAEEVQVEKLNAAQILENSASALNSFPSLFPETPVAMLETTATVLSAVGLAG